MTGAPTGVAGVRAALAVTHLVMGVVLLLPTWAMVPLRSRPSGTALAVVVALAAFPTWVVLIGVRALGPLTLGVLTALRWTDAVALTLGALLGIGGVLMLQAAARSAVGGGGLLGALGFIPLALGVAVVGLALLSLWLVRAVRRGV